MAKKMDKKASIAILTGHLPHEDLGGAQIQALNLAKRLQEHYDIFYFVRTKEKKYSKQEKYENINLVKRSRSNIKFLRFFFDIFIFLSQIRKYRRQVDLLICYQTIINGFLGFLANLFFSIPYVISIRNCKEYNMKRHFHIKLIPLLIYRKSRAIAVQSETIKKEFCQVFPDMKEKIHILPNGIDISSAPAVDRNDLENREGIIYVGRLIPRKGVQYLLEAKKELKNIPMIIVGDGKEKERYQEQARDLNVTFTGVIPHQKVFEYLKKAKILAFPGTRDEGMPNSILEAISLGIPVISSNLPWTAEIVKHNYNGYLLKPQDSKEITHYIKKLYDDNEQYEQMVRNCLDSSKKYMWNNVITSYVALIDKIIPVQV